MMMDEKLSELGIVLAEASVPVGSYVLVSIAGNPAFMSGMLLTDGGRVKQTGRVEEEHNGGGKWFCPHLGRQRSRCSEGRN